MAAVTDISSTIGGTRGDAARKYPPLLAILVAMAIVLAVLPSALNLPQSNPTQTLEYAPVPPDDNSDSPPEGNFSSLGLGSSSGINGEGAKGGKGPGSGPLASLPSRPPLGGTSSDFHCTGSNPTRQTEDPLAPPCVPFFDGDNFGATYQGVTGNEIRLLIYLDGGISYISSSDPTPARRVSPSNKWYDLYVDYGVSDPEHPPHFLVDAFKTWQTYFNARFQHYKRQVHFYLYFSENNGGVTSDERRADAANNFAQFHPFAVLSDATEGYEDEYLKAMARKGVLNFGSFGLRPSSFFQSFPKMIWSYLPSVEQQTESYVNYICTRVAYQGAVSTMTGPDLINRPRKFGMIYTNDPKQQGLRLAADIVKKGVANCGVTIEAESVMPQCCLAQDNGEVPEYAGRDMADFKDKGITTIIWSGGINGNYGKAATGIGYLPEWVIMGDGLLDAYYPIILSQNTEAFDHHAVTVSPQVLQPGFEQQRCWQAYREINKATPDPDLRYACHYYYNLFQFFTGVQVAGPRLGPSSMDKGFHEIPQHPSGNPQVPACFYLPGDYTCVKDAEAMAWSAQDRPPGGNQAGCWRVIEGGQRYLPKDWTRAEMGANLYRPEDPCNGYTMSARFNLR
ncbi:MAG: hypothetical protein QOI20_421 [Acidimicrobiaceae bacterium]|jgi:hypothetical protein|nr:hypothetical protein [Acidimicrobiaceae bacterium]